MASPDCVLVGVSTAADRAAAAWASAVVISSPVGGDGGSERDASDQSAGQHPQGQGGRGSVRQTLDEVFGREGGACDRGGAQVWRRSVESSPERSLIFYFGPKCSFCPHKNGKAKECPNGRCGLCCEALPRYVCAQHGHDTYLRVTLRMYWLHPDSTQSESGEW